jgi:hypothetical protein
MKILNNLKDKHLLIVTIIIVIITVISFILSKTLDLSFLTVVNFMDIIYNLALIVVMIIICIILIIILDSFLKKYTYTIRLISEGVYYIKINKFNKFYKDALVYELVRINQEGKIEKTYHTVDGKEYDLTYYPFLYATFHNFLNSLEIKKIYDL